MTRYSSGWVLALVVTVACGSSKSDEQPAKNVSAATPTPATTAAAQPSAAMGATAAGAAPNLGKVFEGDWADRMLGIMLERKECATRIEPLEAFAAEAAAASQPIWQAEALAATAACLSAEGKRDEAMTRLTEAVKLGYSDCYFLRTDDNLKALADMPGYAPLLDAIKTSLADAQESGWTVGEYSAVFHDTSMMVTENANRVDSQLTVVPQSTIPTRPTSNASVLAGRAMLAAVQGYQKAIVLQADQSRVQHNTSMNIIDSMGDGTSNRGAGDKVAMSRLMASENAGIRRRGVEARAFKLDSPTDVVVCSSIPD